MSEPTLVKNVADPEQIKKAKQKEASIRDNEINDFAWLLSDPKGRRILWRIFEFCNINGLSYRGERIHDTNFNEGMKNVANMLLADIMETRPEAYIEMLREHNKEIANAG